MHRLYIVEGLPCSGKSTTSKFIAETLSRKGIRVFFFDENCGNHPADYEFHSFLSNLSDFSIDEQNQIKSCTEKKENGYIVPLSKFGGDIFNKLLRYKIYDFLPWETEKPIMLSKWRDFAENADNEAVYVFNCCMIQNPMCETMMRFGFSQDVSEIYIKEIADIISPLNPMIVYLKNDDIRESVIKASAEREGWLDAVIDYHISGEYGRSINAAGFEGYIACLEERQKREISILSQLKTDSIIIENPHRSWENAYNTIKEAIK